MGKLGETGAHAALTDTARLRLREFAERCERTQPMPIMDRRARMREAQVMRHNQPGLPAFLSVQAE